MDRPYFVVIFISIFVVQQVPAARFVPKWKKQVKNFLLEIKLIL